MREICSANLEDVMKKKPKVIEWLPKPADKDYPAAELFLTLLFSAKRATSIIKKLRKEKTTIFLAKDILRASETPIEQVQAYDWVKQNAEIQAGIAISPLLLVRQNNGSKLIVADGFHRLCAAFALDQDAKVPCRIV